MTEARKHPSASVAITDAFVEDVAARLARGQRVRRALPEGGRLHIDRALPFLCVHRLTADRADDSTAELVTAEASYLVAPGGERFRPRVALLVRRIVETLSRKFGGFLLVELWESRDAARSDGASDAESLAVWRPGFRLATGGPGDVQTAVAALERVLPRVRLLKQPAEVARNDRSRGHPPELRPLAPHAVAASLDCHVLGIEVRPIWRDASTGTVYPTALRALRRGVSRSLKHALFAFAQTHTHTPPEHFHAMGRRTMVKAVWEADRRLAEISDAFDFLLQVTPINAAGAWHEFNRADFRREPVFHYRPLTVDPSLLKRRLYGIPIERLEDPTIAHLFQQKQDELDRKITMLTDIGTPRFLHGAIQIYDAVEPSLLKLARRLLDDIPPSRRGPTPGRQLDGPQFARRAQAEIDHYRRISPDFRAQVSVRDDIYWGLLVSAGDLLVGRQAAIPAARVVSLLNHEIGTHLVTYYNGRAQPFRQLYSGLAGYESLQEGLAVLAEYLTGGIGPVRMRLLAARVVAAHMLVDGATFVDTFAALHQTHGFSLREAYTVTMRVYRGGGLTKDAIYLRGLVGILDYLHGGGDLEPLFIGKIAAEHVPLIRELQLREVLRQPPLRPRYLDQPDALAKLERLRRGLNLRQLIEDTTP